MKIKPKIYAELLLESIKGKADFKEVAANLWHLLQKNKQYKELPKILGELEKAYAVKEGFEVAYIESGKELTPAELKEIESKITAKLGSKVILKTAVKSNMTGIVAKTRDEIIDLSLENKIGQLRKRLIV